MDIEPIAYYRCPLKEKFGCPRQSGLAPVEGRIEFTGQFRDPLAVRGLEGFSHIWLLWGFSANREGSSRGLTVRPPRLGGNERLGVFATRSPYRPNPVGLSCVELKSVGEGCIEVVGADLMDGTPIYDIKPYIPYTDSHPEASSGFVGANPWQELEVVVPEGIVLPEGLAQVLRQDPRPQYQDDPGRIYGLSWGDSQVHFKVEGNILTVLGMD
ncbi:MAG: tRNA (N6-threonylcarbamoyladenosine(37)-N6)-methyltransferase TrmO [Bacteroidales bacterium]|nr:tRNA (N6-threonylcarbamoyladenosine(37)-N6)-methyltransferase TrmO [Bacteroidales bacterium]